MIGNCAKRKAISFPATGFMWLLPSGSRRGYATPAVCPLNFLLIRFKRPASGPLRLLDRNLAYLGLVEILAGYPLDGVVLTTGCDKTTPAAIMAAATVNLPAIVLSAGPMLDGYVNGKLGGLGLVLWEARRHWLRGKLPVSN